VAKPSASESEMALAGKAPSRGRRRSFQVIAVLMAVSGVAFGLFTAVFGILAESQKIHAVHNAAVATLLLVISAPAAIAAARFPERSIRALLHLAMVGVAGLLTMIASLTLDPFTLPFVLLVAVLWALRPTQEQPLSIGRPSPVLLLMVVAGAVPLVAYGLDQAELQRIDNFTEHAEFFHWVETSFFVVAIVLLGLLAAVRPATYRWSAWSGGVALAVLGGASLALPGYASALITGWAWAALAGSVVFVGLTEWERRRGPVGHPEKG
jgi:MFS family permease